MKAAVAFLTCAMLMNSAVAKDKEKLSPISEADAAGLQGKTIALTRHEKPSFGAMTAGKASFGLLGAGAMISAGNTLVRENNIADPAEQIRDTLADELARAYGAKFLPVDATPTKANKPTQLAGLHADADYVLDVRGVGWMYLYYPTDWAHYNVLFSVQVQLVETKTGRLASKGFCFRTTKEHPKPPTRDQLHANGAQLLKDVSASLGWSCTDAFARNMLRIPPELVVATPAELVDPIASVTKAVAQPAEVATDATMAPSVSDAPAVAPVTDPAVLESAVEEPAEVEAAADGRH